MDGQLNALDLLEPPAAPAREGTDLYLAKINVGFAVKQIRLTLEDAVLRASCCNDETGLHGKWVHMPTVMQWADHLREGIDATLKVLERNADHQASFADIAMASMNAARDPDTKTPGRIFQITQHWPEAVKDALPSSPPCPEHPWESAHHCRACLADLKAGDRPLERVGAGERPPAKPKPPPADWRPPKTEPRPIPAARPTT